MATKNSIRKEYIGRINDVIIYIHNNLDEELQLNKLARIACFSPFHFHRIFTTITGETLNNYINRLRIEHIASRLLLGTEEAIADLGYKYGFKSASNLSRSFKKYYGISPSEFKERIPTPFSKIRQVDRKNGQEQVLIEEYICNIDNYLNWLKMNAKIEVKEMPAFKMVYFKHVGQFDQIGEAYHKLFRWAGPKGLLQNPNFNTVTVYLDDPKVTDINKVRQCAGITVENDVHTDGEAGLMEVKKDKYAVGRFEISALEFTQAWDSMCVWVAEKGYTSKDGHYYEMYYNDHEQHPEKKFILDICIPVE